jgi:hypothetical protein
VFTRTLVTREDGGKVYRAVAVVDVATARAHFAGRETFDVVGLPPDAPANAPAAAAPKPKGERKGAPKPDAKEETREDAGGGTGTPPAGASEA